MLTTWATLKFSGFKLEKQRNALAMLLLWFCNHPPAVLSLSLSLFVVVERSLRAAAVACCCLLTGSESMSMGEKKLFFVFPHRALALSTTARYEMEKSQRHERAAPLVVVIVCHKSSPNRYSQIFIVNFRFHRSNEKAKKKRMKMSKKKSEENPSTRSVCSLLAGSLALPFRTLTFLPYTQCGSVCSYNISLNSPTQSLTAAALRVIGKS